MKRYMLASTMVVAVLFLLTLGASSASADITRITFDLTSDHCTGGCGTPPFGDVVLTQDGTSVDFVVTLFNGNQFVRTGSADFQYFKFNATDVTVGDITVTTPSGLTAFSGALNGDGTGDFGFGICKVGFCTAGGGIFPIPGPIEFTIANATIADVIVPNNLGNVFVADILSQETGNTGPVDATTGVVPDGGMTVMLLGSALLGLETLRRRLSA